MDEHFETFKKRLYVQTLAIILEKLQIPFEFSGVDTIRFNLHAVRDQFIDTTNMSVADIDNVIKIVLTR